MDITLHRTGIQGRVVALGRLAYGPLARCRYAPFFAFTALCWTLTGTSGRRIGAAGSVEGGQKGRM